MVFRNQVEWALHCAIVLAGLTPGKTLSANVLANFHGIPKEYLAKALQSLAAAGLVSGTTGPRGGYALLRPADAITFLEIVEAIEGKGGHFLCREIRMNNPCRTSNTRDRSICGIARVMLDADEAWREVLRKTTLMDIVETLPDQIPPDIAKETASWIAQRAGHRTPVE